MSEIKIHRCDVCRVIEEINQPWYMNFNGNLFVPGEDGINHNISIEHLCPACRRVIYRAVETVLEGLKK